jgi:hypothetical protein
MNLSPETDHLFYHEKQPRKAAWDTTQTQVEFVHIPHLCRRCELERLLTECEAAKADTIIKTKLEGKE